MSLSSNQKNELLFMGFKQDYDRAWHLRVLDSSFARSGVCTSAPYRG
ncbi:unnamed protein product, partial [Ascophyllum nodosum]